MRNVLKPEQNVFLLAIILINSFYSISVAYLIFFLKNLIQHHPKSEKITIITLRKVFRKKLPPLPAAESATARVTSLALTCRPISAVFLAHIAVSFAPTGVQASAWRRGVATDAVVAMRLTLSVETRPEAAAAAVLTCSALASSYAASEAAGATSPNCTNSLWFWEMSDADSIENIAL